MKLSISLDPPKCCTHVEYLIASSCERVVVETGVMLKIWDFTLVAKIHYSLKRGGIHIL
jgi:hypothetical protein